MAWRGFTGLKTYTLPLSNDLRELERWLHDIDVKLGKLTRTDVVSTPINADPTYAVPASIHIYAINGLSQTPGSTLEQDMYLFVNVDYNFPWTGAHHWSSGAAETPIRITAATSQTNPLVRVERGETYDWVHVDENGLVGLSDDPDALLCERARAITSADILALSPWAWWDAADPNANGGTHTYVEGDAVPTLYDKTTNHRDATPGTGGTAMRWFYRTTGESITPVGRHAKKPGTSTGRPTSAYLSCLTSLGAVSNSYNSIVGSASISRFTILGVVALTGARDNAIVGSSRSDTSNDGASVGSQGTGADVGGNTACVRTTSTSGGNPQYESTTTLVSADETEFCIQTFRRTARTPVEFWIDGSAVLNLTELNFTNERSIKIDSINRSQQKNGTNNQGGNFIAEIIVFDYALSDSQLALVRQFFMERYGKSAFGGSVQYDLVRLKDYAGTTRAVYSKDFRLGMNVGTTPVALLDLVPNSAAEVVSQITGAPTQTANLQNWRVDPGTTRSYVDSSGYLYAYDGGATVKLPQLNPLLLMGA